jgi:hypothetical protein
MFDLHFFNGTRFESYEAADKAGAVFVCEAPAYDSEVEKWGFRGGVLCDAMQAVQAALECAGFTDSMEAVLFDGKNRICAWGDEEPET